jgi:molybdate transport system substrate-binding protein
MHQLLRGHSAVVVVVLALVLPAVLAATGCASADSTDSAGHDGESLLVYSGAALRKPMDEIGTRFKAKYGCTIQYTYAGSAQNLSQLELTGEGDVYVPGDESYTDIIFEKGLSEKAQPVVYHIPTIAVPKGNPAGITCLADLAKPGVKVVLGDPKSASVGKLSVKMLKDAGLLEDVSDNVVAQTATEPEMVVYISMNQADAGIIWEDNVFGVENIEAVKIADDLNKTKTVPIAVLKSTTNHDLAQLFADFVASDEAESVWVKYGFKPVK